MARGDGRIFQRGQTFWCSFYVRGKGEQRESCKTTDPKQAEKYLRARIKAVHRSELDLKTRFLTIADHKRTVGQLMDSLQKDFKLRGKLSRQNLCLIERVKRDFENIRATALNSEAVTNYVSDRLADGYKNATINRLTTVLRQAYKLAELPCPKVVHLYEGDNVRSGFFTNEEIRRVMANLSPDLADFVLFAWSTGMRLGEIRSLAWSNVEDDVIVLRAEDAKSGHSRTIPLVGELDELISRRRKVRGQSDLIFNRNGQRGVGNFRKSWKRACTMAGIQGRLFHDLRRSAVRDMSRSGVPDSVAMSISGHRTMSMYKRYNISDQADRRLALAKVQEYRLLAKENEQEQPAVQAVSTAIN
jgi:integrase